MVEIKVYLSGFKRKEKILKDAINFVLNNCKEIKIPAEAGIH
ncbi:MAG: hypothetical protein M5T52_21815 [Ignavibacteriaceae bacterium]|nr:hypothetical protein [Ignavibacteriaceae bacterium]